MNPFSKLLLIDSLMRDCLMIQLQFQLCCTNTVKAGSGFLSPRCEATMRRIRTEPEQMSSDLIKSEGQQRQLLSLTKSSCPPGIL